MSSHTELHAKTDSVTVAAVKPEGPSTAPNWDSVDLAAFDWASVRARMRTPEQIASDRPTAPTSTQSGWPSPS